ncbi:MAG: 1-acyl-sn-glycerol-3-phosphate acyltransferase [Ruminococcaceae bacterium]|nr:1-acyl-sn-glycerol-3-phosphate acyltransferase [Oscillospiraceae bacterium]
MKSKTYSRLQKYLGGFVRFIFRIHSHGGENEPTDTAYVIVSNHTSNADPVFLCAATKHQQPHFMAKKELFKIPLVRGLVKALGAFPVDRNGNDVGAIKKSIQMLKDGYCVGIFPQGHRYKKVDPRDTEVKNGAAMLAVRSGVQVLPCYVKMKNNRWAPLRRVDVYIGQPISVEELRYDENAKGEYSRISAYIFDKVCSIGEENA